MWVFDLIEVMVVECQVYLVLWMYGNFVDFLVVGYLVEVLCGLWVELLGYWVVMLGVDEMYLFNIIVVLVWQGCGLVVFMFDCLVVECCCCGLMQLWLEVCVGNVWVCEVYWCYGFVEVG